MVGTGWLTIPTRLKKPPQMSAQEAAHHRALTQYYQQQAALDVATSSGLYQWVTNPTSTVATTAYYPTWLTNGTTATTTANTIVWADNSNWYNNWVCTPDEWADYHARRAVAAPHVHRITEQELAERDQELYRRAVEQHDQQEIDRLARQMAERAAIAERRALDAQRHQEEVAQRKIAQGRASEFLLEHLTPEQRKTFKKNRWFIVEGGISKTKYRIRCDHYSANIDVLNSDNTMVGLRLCGHAAGDIPLGDQLLAQKMMLQFSEDEFLRLANRHQA